MCCVFCGFPKRGKLSHLSESERCDEFSPFLRGAYAENLHPSGWLVAERGVQPLSATRPLGVYDPLKWMTTQPENFARRRAVERKHGRISMAAVLGLLTTNAGIHFPGYLSKTADIKFEDVRPGAMGALDVPPLGWAQIIIFVGFGRKGARDDRGGGEELLRQICAAAEGVL